MGGVGLPMLEDCLLEAIGSDIGVHPSIRDCKGKQKERMWRTGGYLLY